MTRINTTGGTPRLSREKGQSSRLPNPEHQADDDDAHDIGHPGSMDASQLQHWVVIHLDLDCFYAQVEAKRLGIDPSVPWRCSSGAGSSRSTTPRGTEA